MALNQVVDMTGDWMDYKFTNWCRPWFSVVCKWLVLTYSVMPRLRADRLLSARLESGKNDCRCRRIKFFHVFPATSVLKTNSCRDSFSFRYTLSAECPVQKALALAPRSLPSNFAQAA
jgi:hypothetical protein